MPLERFADETFFDAIGKAHSLGVSAIEGYGSQKVSIEIPKNLDYRLAPGEIRAVADRLAALGTRMPVYLGPAITQDREIGRKLFEFAKQLKVETVVLEHAPASMPLLEELANEYDINVALEGRLNTVVDALQGRGRRIGAYADIGAWMKEGVTPVDAISRLKDRVFAMRLSDRNALGAKGRPVALGSGAAGIAQLLGDVYRMQLKPSLIAVDSMGGPEVVTDLNRSLEGFEKAIQTVAARRVAELSREIPIKGSDRLTPEDRTRIAGAVPNQAAIKPEKHRKLLVFDANIGYGGQTGGHRSIPAANLAIELFAKATGAYEAVFSNELENFRPDKIRQFDAVFLNNTVGMIFVDPEIRESLARFVRDGGGLAGYHGTSHASMDWPEFGEMLGAIGGSHREPTEIATVTIEDPKSPLMAAFRATEFVHQDEFYRFFEGTPSRRKVRVLMSLDVQKTDMNQGRECPSCARSDSDYPLSWVRSYGKGRVFYTALGHAPAFFAVPELNQFFFAGIQFVLGDLKVDTTPSGISGVAGGR